jgi:hypothetical protein
MKKNTSTPRISANQGKSTAMEGSVSTSSSGSSPFAGIGKANDMIRKNKTGHAGENTFLASLSVIRQATVTQTDVASI